MEYGSTEEVIKNLGKLLVRRVCEHNSVTIYTPCQPRKGIQWRTLPHMVGSTTVSIIGMTGRNTLKSVLETLSSHLDWGVQRGGPNRRMKGMASG